MVLDNLSLNRDLQDHRNGPLRFVLWHPLGNQAFGKELVRVAHGVGS